eukprot:CAMPEP_0173139572 /NCGR_PEP_ID=MMETSP1105-20130129/4337_1 /TAXON_ID=2985 /ORGANISM="Ochromonas sp., Strain BG-1" /LENGTH=289 /DNA_ID=CAMNT_0014052327 /DNA_START=1202 /DNA_END=2071 /DNA_ORIENTATION=+
MVISSVIFYQGPGWTTTQATLVYGACCAIFYLYWHKHQVFSEEEKKNMFQAYLINANREKRNRIKNRVLGANGTQAKDSTQNKASSQQNKLNSNLFTNKVAPEVLVGKELPPSQTKPRTEDVEETIPAYEYRTEVAPSERLPPVIEERRASHTAGGGIGLAEPTGLLSAASSVVNLAAGLMSYLSVKSKAMNQGQSIHRDAANTSGKSVGSVLSRASAISKRSVLSEYQEMAILQAGGMIDEEEEDEAPSVFPSMAAHLHFQPPAPNNPSVEETREQHNIARTNTDELV